MSKSYYINETIFSSGGVLVDLKAKTVCLVFKKTSNEWLLPKGRLEINETIEENASREIYEETGYKNEIKKFLSVQIRPDKVVFWFLAFKTDNYQKLDTQMEDENFEFRWFGADEALDKLKWEEDKQLLKLAFAYV